LPPGAENQPRLFLLCNHGSIASTTLVVVLNPVPSCAKPTFFCLSQFEKCSYSEKAQRFLTTTDLN
jgi:hypothetical protein